MKLPPSHSAATFASKMFILSVFGVSLLSPDPVAATMPETIVLQAADYTETLSPEDIARFMKLETRMRYAPPVRSEIEDTTFCPTEQSLCDFSLSRAFRERFHVTTMSAPDTDALRTFTEAIAEKVLQDPVDVKFSVADNHVIIAEPEKLGRRLKQEESLVILKRALETATTDALHISLPTEVTQPKLIASDRERLGLKELIGEGRTNFKGSPKNRIYNIKRSLEQFQNLIIAPGEEFSFVDHLGEVDGEHGYLPELVIKNNRTEPEFGGGICQVSSTVFRAAVFSGMKITERRNHAYPVKYYAPYGMDATIYIPKPDLAFRNNTPGAVLMQSTIEDTELTFRFYGTKDGRTVTVDGPHILESKPDGSMKTVFSQLVTDREGTSIINDSFWSNYKSPSLFPHPGEVTIYKEKPDGWSKRQWDDYKKINP